LKNILSSVRRSLINGKRSSRWSEVRALHIQKHPACAYCGGTKDLEAHHVRPFHLWPELELDPRNLITLCEAIGHQCHLRIGHLGNWSRFNPFVREICEEAMR
jgi:5-methylcytosine-specific restriction endonuclease McrA